VRCKRDSFCIRKNLSLSALAVEKLYVFVPMKITVIVIVSRNHVTMKNKGHFAVFVVLRGMLFVNGFHFSSK
jgi:hypothetical protein